ncbi:hypothetical protein G7Z17_g1408 [Cylindrodendrum hubeiense]|uniref:Polyketide synthase-like phosphopantetheine-binding domain-containing protein n=1 Tax=Cylindrodendrum hubeiense TaxID=595255 RepID=A0A9P5LFC9_9HYPO|nr:hypothetical protein G7Z17_g1408 [Cylindrodendrum hubeiense]
MAPTTLVEIVRDPEHLENLGRLKQIAFAGGPCPQAVGDLISSKTRLLNALGTTECGFLPTQECDPEDWAYLSVSPVFGHQYRHVSEGLYEQVVVRDTKLQLYQGIFETFSDLNEWPMKDLYSKHPTKEDLWLYRGRVDDMIVFSTGEKLNPLDMENIISSSPVVSAALVTGAGRFQSSLLVEAVNQPKNEEEREELLETIWKTVQLANKDSPSHGRIHRNMIILTSGNKRMLRAGKGTVQRKMTVDMYAEELDALYDANTRLVHDPANTSNTHRSVLDTIKHIVSTATNIDIEGLSPEADLFELGIDSLQVTLISRSINAFLLARGKSPSLDARTVYSNPRIAALAAVVSALSIGKDPANSIESDEQKMKRLYDLYSANMPVSMRQPRPKSCPYFVVLLTGSTGSLGSYILDSLISNPLVSRIYCLNRGGESLERQQKSQAAKGLQPLPSKVKCLDANLSKPYFGLSLQKYRRILSEVTNVVHNAWRVDFNLSIDSFTTHIGIVRQLIDFSAHSTFGAQLFFISSISSVAGLKGTILEKVYEDWLAPQGMGYGQSKFVSERLLDTAAKEADIPCVICRVGQIAGPTTVSGMWPKHEWLPSLIASSKYLGKLPMSLGPRETLNWIPVDILGKSIVELVTMSKSTQDAGATVFHAINPYQNNWENLVPVIRRHLSTTSEIEMVPLEIWLEVLRESASKSEDMAHNPATKIITFFEGLFSKSSGTNSLEVKETAPLSPTLATLGPVQDKWVDNWMKQWAF